jgi:hypothetical protein
MKRRRVCGRVGTLAVVALLLSAQGAAGADKQPLVSSIRGISPPAPGLEAKVLGDDTELSLTNKSGTTVIVKGYDGEPYLRFLPGGTVQVNDNSAAKYVNADRYGQTPIPSNITPQSPVRWIPVAGGGSYRWIDHRIHLTERGRPPQVKDPSRRTKIFDWRVPLTVDGRSARVLGTLTWAPKSSSGSNAALIAALGAAGLAAVLAAAFLVARRRRSPAVGPRGEKAVKEAW